MTYFKDLITGKCFTIDGVDGMVFQKTYNKLPHRGGSNAKVKHGKKCGEEFIFALYDVVKERKE